MTKTTERSSRRGLASLCLALATALLLVAPASHAAQPERSDTGDCGAQLAAPGRAGAPLALSRIGLSLRPPPGWSATWTDGRARSYYSLSGAPTGPGGFVTATLTFLAAAQRSGGLDQLLQLEVPKDAELVGTRRFAIGDRCAGSIVYRSGADESAVVLVRVGDWLYAVLARYPAGAAELMRAGLETALAAATFSPPARNLALEKKVAGCWRQGQASTSHGGGASTGANLRLEASGAYRWETYTTVSTPGGSLIDRDVEEGEYRVVGDQLITARSAGGSGNRRVALSAGFLLVGSQRYMPCS